jgi:hypothetical protein
MSKPQTLTLPSFADTRSTARSSLPAQRAVTTTGMAGLTRLGHSAGPCRPPFGELRSDGIPLCRLDVDPMYVIDSVVVHALDMGLLTGSLSPLQRLF